jgi:hypothetical protein
VDAVSGAATAVDYPIVLSSTSVAFRSMHGSDQLAVDGNTRLCLPLPMLSASSISTLSSALCASPTALNEIGWTVAARFGISALDSSSSSSPSSIVTLFEYPSNGPSDNSELRAANNTHDSLRLTLADSGDGIGPIFTLSFGGGDSAHGKEAIDALLSENEVSISALEIDTDMTLVDETKTHSIALAVSWDASGSANGSGSDTQDANSSGSAEKAMAQAKVYFDGECILRLNVPRALCSAVGNKVCT